MRLLGPPTKEIEGEIFILEETLESRDFANSAAKIARDYGYKAQIKPVVHKNKQYFQLWVSEFPTRQTAPPAPQPQE